jgi:hypothetical protein
MSPELLVVTDMLEEIQHELATRSPSDPLRDWPVRTEAYAHIVEAWLRFGSSPTEVQRIALFENVAALHGEIFGSGYTRLGRADTHRREIA